MQDEAALNSRVGLQAIDQPNSRFQSNANIILMNPGPDTRLIGNQVGAHPHQASAPFVPQLAPQNYQQQRLEKDKEKPSQVQVDPVEISMKPASRSAQFGGE